MCTRLKTTSCVHLTILHIDQLTRIMSVTGTPNDALLAKITSVEVSIMGRLLIKEISDCSTRE